MKLRHDFVSNSSSASFIIGEKNSVAATKLFIDDFGIFLRDGNPMGDLRVSATLKKGKRSESLDISELIEQLQTKPEKINDIVELYFDCDDYDVVGMTYINFLYRYFEKFGYNPDASDTERSLWMEENSTFLSTLINKINWPEAVEQTNS